MNFAPLPGLSAADVATLRDAIDQAVITGARAPLIFATIVVCFGAVLSFLIPQVGPSGPAAERPSATTTTRSLLAIEESELMAESITTQ